MSLVASDTALAGTAVEVLVQNILTGLRRRLPPS